MTEPTEVQVLPDAQLVAGLNRLIGAGGPFNGAIISLYQNPVAVNHGSLLADFNVATFVGYADSAAITWSLPYRDIDGTFLTIGTDWVFQATSNATPNQIFGYILATAARAALLAAYAFQVQVPVVNNLDSVVVVPFLRYSGV